MIKNRQQGGTILGIIIGLVIGLGIALAVAMAITKSPMTFTDKAVHQKINELTGQTFDPNKPLYSKQTKKAIDEVARDPVPENTAAQQPADKTQEAKLEPKADAKPEQKVESKPAADKKVDAAEGEDKWSYYLQAGAFRDQGDAEGMRAKLALQGVEAKVSERQADTGVLYRVRVGPFAQIEAMNKVRGKLTDNGIDAAVLRVPK